MNIDIVLKTLAVLVVVVPAIINLFKEKTKNLSLWLISGAFTMLTAESEVFMYYFVSEESAPSEPSVYAYIFAGIALIAGIIINLYEKEQHQVFNLIGENNRKELINNNYKVKGIKTGVIRERSIDFMSLANFKKIDDNTNQLMVNVIKDEATNINHYPQNKNIYITSMASIPHSVLFGTYLNEKKNTKYINYNRDASSFVLLSAKYNLRNKRKQVSLTIEERLSETEVSDKKEVLVAISGTFPIHDSDIEDFQLKDRIYISTSNITQNNLTTQEEVISISSEIIDCLLNLSKTYEVIHIVAAIPGMLSVEIGKLIRNRGNQLSEIIVYHYNNQSKPKYKFGVTVNGESKNKLIERRI